MEVIRNREYGRELYDEFERSEFGEHLAKQVRFGSFKPESVSNEEWWTTLGADFNNLWHMQEAALLTEHAAVSNRVSASARDLLIRTAYIHDWAEAIDGDVPDPDKDHSKEARLAEVESFYTVAETIVPNPIELTLQTFKILHNEDEGLGRLFRATEIVGYAKASLKALDAYYWTKGELQQACGQLFNEVAPKEADRLQAYRDYGFVDHFLLEHEDTLRGKV